MTKYVSCGIWKGSYLQFPLNQSFTLVEKVPIAKVRVDKRLFSYQNEVDISQVDFICENFDPDFWMPILINRDLMLLDGQHRLEVARRLGHEFIDAVVNNEWKPA